METKRNFQFRIERFRIASYLLLFAMLFAYSNIAIGSNTSENNDVLLSGPQQQVIISGTVTDENGAPMIGVNVSIKGTTVGTITNSDGKYSINVEPTDRIVVSFIGYIEKEILIGEQTIINITLLPALENLDEVVVVGYAIQRRVNVTGAVASLQSEDIVKVPVANASNLIVGRLPGIITKQTSGAPGNDGVDINIRGFGSPLVIVDGIERSFSDISADEIESISVLKDASAAIYGARAGNGVILVTTKRGSGEKPQLTYKNSYSFQGVANYPGFVNSGQYAELYLDAQKSDGIPEIGWAYTDEEIENYYSGADGYANGDWWKATINDWSPMQQHTLSAKGGSEKMKFYTLVGYTGQTGMYTSGDNKMDRFNIRSNVDYNISKNLSMAIDLSGKVESLSKPIASTDMVFTHIYNALSIYPTELPDPDIVPYSGKGPQNPVAITSRDISGYNDQTNNKYQASLRLNYKIPFIEGLKAQGRIDYYGKSNFDKLWEKDYDLYDYNQTTDVYILSATQDKISLREDFDKSRIITSQFNLTYNRDFGDHNIKGLLLYEQIDSKGNNFWAMRQEFISSGIEQLYVSGIEFQDLSGRAWEDGRISYIGRANYSYKGKYLAEGSFRYDGSNRFPEETRWGLFPSFSAGWRLSEESFMDFSWLDNLKLRASFGQSGRDNTGKYQFLTGYEFGGDYIMNDLLVRGITSTGVPNEFITWENMTTYNTGFDLSALRHKIDLEFDVFYRLREGMLATRSQSLPNTLGATLPDENINDQSNRGFELSIGHKNKVNDFSYSVRGMISWARAKWEYYDEPIYTDPDDIRINQKTGKWTNVKYGYESLGFFQTQEEIDEWVMDQDNNGNGSLAPGDIKYSDINNDSILDWRDKVEIGKLGTPEWMLGFYIDLNYKGFDFSMLVQGAFDHYVEMQQRSVFSSSFPKPFEYMYTDRWTEGSTDALYPRNSLSSVNNNAHDSDFWIMPASYVRLKNISLGYTIPGKLVNKVGISNLRVFVAGQNLFTVSKLNKYGFDPEAPNNLTGKYYPQMRVVSFGLSVTL